MAGRYIVHFTDEYGYGEVDFDSWTEACEYRDWLNMMTDAYNIWISDEQEWRDNI